MSASPEHVSYAIGRAVLQIPTGELIDAWIEQNLLATPRLPSRSLPVPKIGETWPEEFGVFAGICRGQDGSEDYYLIVPSTPAAQTKGLQWQAALDWARALAGPGTSGCTLPNRQEMRVLWANVPELFETDEWYWTSEQYAGLDAYAWAQGFGYGSQGYCFKDNEFRARVVRRLTIR